MGRRTGGIAMCFKGQLHIPLIIGIARAATQIMHHEKFEEAHIPVFLTVFGIMFKNQWQFQQLVRLC